jgi:hypothetical protein
MCLIGIPGGVLSSTDPTGGSAAWQFTSLPLGEYGSLGLISRPTTQLCVGADGTLGVDDLLTSTDPTGGTSAWSITSLPGLFGVSSLSCRRNSCGAAPTSCWPATAAPARSGPPPHRPNGSASLASRHDDRPCVRDCDPVRRRTKFGKRIPFPQSNGRVSSAAGGRPSRGQNRCESGGWAAGVTAYPGRALGPTPD